MVDSELAAVLGSRGTRKAALPGSPHLVDQWVTELQGRFHLQPVAVTAGGAARLERDLPPSESIFTTHPPTVVSLDYIKSDRRRAEFLRACPEFVIVDEAHTCAATGQGRHQRYELLRGLAESPSRHLVMLTATPHSGDEQAFYRLLGLLEPCFEALESVTGDARTELRERLSRHFVQRRRPDIAEWQEGNLFPRRETTELTYKLTGAWERFFDAVLSYCASVVDADALSDGDDSVDRQISPLDSRTDASKSRQDSKPHPPRSDDRPKKRAALTLRQIVKALTSISYLDYRHPTDMAKDFKAATVIIRFARANGWLNLGEIVQATSETWRAVRR